MAKSSKSSTKKASAPKTKKKAANTAAPKTEAAAPARPIRREVGGVGLLVLAALSVVGLFNYGGAVTAGFTDILKGLIGYGYYILPVALLLGGLTLLRHRGRPVRFRVFSALVLPILLAALLNQIYFLNDSANSALPELTRTLFLKGQSLQSGGVVGGMLSLLLFEILKLFLKGSTFIGFISATVFAVVAVGLSRLTMRG